MSIYDPKNKLKLNVYLFSGQVELDSTFALNPEAPPDEEADPCPDSPPPPTPTCAKINKTTKVSVTLPPWQETAAKGPTPNLLGNRQISSAEHACAWVRGVETEVLEKRRKVLFGLSHCDSEKC